MFYYLSVPETRMRSNNFLTTGSWRIPLVELRFVSRSTWLILQKWPACNRIGTLLSICASDFCRLSLCRCKASCTGTFSKNAYGHVLNECSNTTACFLMIGNLQILLCETYLKTCKNALHLY